MNKQPTDHLVILGIDADKRPHAAAFAAADEALVSKAAGLLGMRLGRASDDKARALARKLPAGKIFATGKALVPLVRQAIFDGLVDALTFDAAPTAASNTGDKPLAANSKPGEPLGEVGDPWAQLKVGDVVLCREDAAEPGWWESVVVSIGADRETLVLRWRDYPKLASFTAKRHAVAFLPPGPMSRPPRA